MSKLFDAVGHTYGRLTVLKSLGVRNKKQIVISQCSCGNLFEAPLSNLRSGNSLSCGCLRKEVTSRRVTTHGYRHTRLYRVYTAMLQRCTNPNDRSYFRYGGRGIQVCPQWLLSINSFMEWALATNYSDELELDRKDVNGSYSPENCQWATETTQSRNRRTMQHSSIYTGVHYHAKRQKWESAITVNKVRVHLGTFATEEEAWIARCKYVDSNALQNFQTNRQP